MHSLKIDVERRKGVISRHLYGHFSEHLGRCIYGSLYVGPDSPIPNVRGIRRDVVEALRHIRIPNLRWPGGCFADEYHWKDGVGDPALRKRMVNTHWGGVVEDNRFGTHEFMDLCEQLGCEPYINGNLGSGTVQEMPEWVEYLTFGGVSPMAQWRRDNGREEPWKVKFFGVGNENWGCGGNMRPEYYADCYRRYQTYLRNFDGNQLYKVACGPSDGNYAWTEVLMREAGRYMHALTLHYYTVPGTWQHKGSATQFDAADYYHTLRKALKMEELVDNHLQIMHRYDPEHRVGLIVDEWGTWYDVEPGTHPGFLYQQNTMRDALVAAATLDIFNHRCDRVVMANLAQLTNVLQSPILTDGADLVLTPTYHVFDLYKEHQDAALVDLCLVTDTVGEGEDALPRLSGTASVGADGSLHLTLSNRSADEAAPLTVRLQGLMPRVVQGRVLTGPIQAHNDFGSPDAVSILPLEGIEVQNNALAFTLPPCSVAALRVEA